MQWHILLKFYSVINSGSSSLQHITRISPRVIIIPRSFASFHSTLSKSKIRGGLGKHTASPFDIWCNYDETVFFSSFEPLKEICNVGCPLLHNPFIISFTYNYYLYSLYLSLVLTQTFPSLEGVPDSMTVLVQIAGNNSKSLASAFLPVHSRLYRIGLHRQITSRLSGPLGNTTAVIVNSNFARWGQSIIHTKRNLEILP